MKHILIALIVASSLPAAAGEAVLQDVRGHVRVIDGDTFWILTPHRRVEIRPGGIDAPELKQRCETVDHLDLWPAGIAARDWLAGFLKDRRVMCWLTGETSYRRLIADCLVDGRPLQDAIVRAGWAFDYRRYSGGRHAAAEDAARTEKRGVWQARCDRPEDFRRRSR